ncbi:MAG: hypothetical protein JXB46_05060 [Candidatus Eisenbacteria bacterium]|nr:hypothetical protein [Candidatus Eisenbacteria bacterium]
MDAGQRPDPPWGAFEVKDCALVAIATGRRARNLLELRDEIRTVDAASIYYHFWGSLLRPTFDDPRFNNSFAIWADHALHNTALAERLSVIDPTDFEDMEQLRTRVVEVIDQDLARTGLVPSAPEGAEFDFIRSQIVIFDTGKRLLYPADLPEAVAGMSKTSVFYHFIDARRRTPDSVDDFRTWLADIDRTGFAELCTTLAGIDPFYGSLEETRAMLREVFTDFLGA